MRVRTETREHATDGRTGKFTVVNAPLWVNILPLTADNEVVLVQQFRHGTSAVTLEIPGGVVMESENPLDAAMRECLEETGWGASHPASLLGIVEPNPAFMENRCYVYVWKDCVSMRPQNLDPLEDISVHVVPVETFLHYAASGKIRHSLVLSAIALALLSSQLTLGSKGVNNG